MGKKNKTIHSKAFLDGIIINSNNQEVIYNKSQGKIIKTKFKKYNDIFYNVPIIRGNAKAIKHIVLFLKSLNCTLENMEIELKENEQRTSNAEKKVKEILNINTIQLLFLISLLIGIIASLFLFILMPSIIVSILFKFINIDILLSIIEGFLRLLLFAIFIKATHKIGVINILFMYHGAEHKYLQCIKNKQEPTFENVKKTDKYYSNCVTYNLYKFAFIVVLYFSFFNFDASYVVNLTMRLLLIPILLGISYELKVLFVEDKTKISKLGKIIQNIFIEEPSDEILITIINAMEEIEYKGDF